MSTDAPEPETSLEEPTPIPEMEPAGRWKVVVLIPNDGREPAETQSACEAESLWAAVTAPWHPAILTRCADLPRIESVEYPDHPYALEVRLIAAGSAGRLPPDFRVMAADVGAMVIEGENDRPAMVRQILGCIPEDGEAVPDEDRVVEDFLALGAAWWWLRDLTTAMGHADSLDHESLRREVLHGARSWRSGDTATATNRLRAAFEMLTQARERFYPVDAYILDLCLLDPTTDPATLTDALEARAPVTLLATARAVEALSQRAPERLQALREAISEGWADVVGGAYGEADEPLRPVESVLWQFRRGAETYRNLIDGRTTETLARRRFGLYPQLPQIARRFGFRFAIHCGFDDGRFPVPPEAKRLWDAPDGSQLETLTRPPIAADRAQEATRLPWRLARTMKEDHVATLAMVHWPDRTPGWYRDLRRIAAYSPVLARWVTASDYFHLTDRPYEAYRPTLDQYLFPYLNQAVARRHPEPISQRVRRARLRARLDGAFCLAAICRAVGVDPWTSDASDESRSPEATEPVLLEDALESGRFEECESGLDRLEPRIAQRLAQVTSATADSGRAGYLVFNPVGIPRRAAVLLEDAAADLRPEGPLIAAQLTEEGVQAVVELPAFGYAWVPRETRLDAEPVAFGVLGASGRRLHNEFLELEIDETTGGIRSLRAPGERSARLGQQLVVSGLPDADSGSVMRADRFEVEYAGPALAQAVVEGRILDPAHDHVLARYRQRVRLWRGRPILELDITIQELDPAWVARIGQDDPWKAYLACRWAWPEGDSELRRTSLLAPFRTTVERPETPDALEITSSHARTTLLFGGLAHHRRHGQRMLDTLLIAGAETARTFRLGVVLDQEYPFRPALDVLGPVAVVPTNEGPPRSGLAGWFFQVDHRGVAVTRVEPADSTDEGHGWGLVFHLLECSGRAARCRLRLIGKALRARQTDFQGDKILDLAVADDTVSIDLTPHELARVEVTLGDRPASDAANGSD